MDNPEDPAIENLLRSARLRAPSDRLDARLEAVFSAGESDRRRRFRLIPLAIAAAVLIVAGPVVWFVSGWFVSGRQHPSVAQRDIVTSHPKEAAEISPSIRIERDTSEVIDDGIVTDSEDTPYQQTRRRTVRDIWYIDPQTHSRLLVRVPTEQVVIQKVEAF